VTCLVFILVSNLVAIAFFGITTLVHIKDQNWGNVLVFGGLTLGAITSVSFMVRELDRAYKGFDL
jgi:hypothetical protein